MQGRSADRAIGTRCKVVHISAVYTYPSSEIVDVTHTVPIGSTLQRSTLPSTLLCPHRTPSTSSPSPSLPRCSVGAPELRLLPPRRRPLPRRRRSAPAPRRAARAVALLPLPPGAGAPAPPHWTAATRGGRAIPAGRAFARGRGTVTRAGGGGAFDGVQADEGSVQFGVVQTLQRVLHVVAGAVLDHAGRTQTGERVGEMSGRGRRWRGEWGRAAAPVLQGGELAGSGLLLLLRRASSSSSVAPPPVKRCRRKEGRKGGQGVAGQGPDTDGKGRSRAVDGAWEAASAQVVRRWSAVEGSALRVSLLLPQLRRGGVESSGGHYAAATAGVASTAALQRNAPGATLLPSSLRKSTVWRCDASLPHFLQRGSGRHTGEVSAVAWRGGCQR